MARKNNHTANKNKQRKYGKLYFIEHFNEYLLTVWNPGEALFVEEAGLPSQDPIFKQRSNPHRKPCLQKFSAKKLYTGKIMSVSAVSNAESNKDLLVDNPKPNLRAK